MRVQLRALDPQQYLSHPLHAKERAWPETNCYVDLWLEVLNGFGFEPTAMLAFTLGIDFEGDQWTFFKPPLEDLKRLYGVQVQELAIWKPSFVDHMAEQVKRGRMPIVEVDAFFLPDTQGTSYRHDHPKTSIGVVDLDLEARTMGYFHNAGYFSLGGDDFAGLWRLDRPAGEVWLPPYVEFVKFDDEQAKHGDVLREHALALAREHYAARPSENPVRTFAPHFHRDLLWLQQTAPEQFHPYAFATLRQLGASFELGASFVRWLGQGDGKWDVAAQEFEAISNTSKALLFKLARVVHNKKPFDPAPMLDQLAHNWQTGMAALGERLA